MWMLVPFIPSFFPVLLFLSFFSGFTPPPPLNLTYSIITQKSWLIIKKNKLPHLLPFGHTLWSTMKKMYLFYRLLRVRWVLRQYLLEHQCGNGKSWSHNCYLPHQDSGLRWHPIRMCTARLDTLCHLLCENLSCCQDRWPLGSNMQ